MIEIKKMTFNPFQENTYILSDETKDCIIIDPGCYDKQEEKTLADYIDSNGLKPVKLVNTHGHIDHVLGNFFISEEYRIDLYAHEKIVGQLESIPNYSKQYGFNGYKMSPQPKHYLKEGDKLVFGNSELEVLFCPGHAPDHIVFYSPEQSFVINGDVLFQGSYGRVDLPGGDFNTLKDSITKKMFALPDDTKVYCGHGGETTIGQERQSNPINH
ncbi:MAG: MBL fold metallo-hydrolase [Crocinitomicaceae bacterium]